MEEVLRFDGPVQVATPRIAREPLTLGGVDLPAGAVVVPSPLAAGRDGGRYDAPDAFAPGRAAAPHLAFGYGIHHCLGAPLARLEGRIALGALAARFPDLRLAAPTDTLTWRPSFLMHGLATLPVTLR